MLPAREAHATVGHEERIRGVREVLRAEPAVGVARGEGDRGDLRDDARVVVLVSAGSHLRVGLVGHEHDAVARHEDRLHVVVVPERELPDVPRAVHVADVKVVVRLAGVAHREDHLAGIEGEVDAVDVNTLERLGEVDEGAIRCRRRERVDTTPGHIAQVIDGLIRSSRDDVIAFRVDVRAFHEDQGVDAG